MCGSVSKLESSWGDGKELGVGCSLEEEEDMVTSLAVFSNGQKGVKVEKGILRVVKEYRQSYIGEVGKDVIQLGKKVNEPRVLFVPEVVECRKRHGCGYC